MCAVAVLSGRGGVRIGSLAPHGSQLTGCLHFLNEGVGVYSEGWRMRLTMQANVTVYIPDFFAGEVLDPVAICEGRWADLDMDGFRARNRREVREPEIFAAAREIRSKGYSKVGAVGFCFGGWAVLRLAAVSLVDAIVCAHPSWVTNEDLDGVHVPVSFLAPEKDHAFSDELKEYAFRTLLGKKKVPFEWVHFPGVEHGCLTKGDEKVEGEREAMVKGKAAAVRWWAEWLG